MDPLTVDEIILGDLTPFTRGLEEAALAIRTLTFQMQLMVPTFRRLAMALTPPRRRRTGHRHYGTRDWQRRYRTR